MANLADFDFDELDKAVAGALSEATPEPEPSLNATPAPAKEVATPVAVPRPAPAARRSTGRFMDVVHPSSDMRSTPPRFTPPVSAPPVASRPAEVVASEDASEKDNWATPLESPFLPDARVEKRPLGTMPATGEAQKEELLLEAPDDPRLGESSMPDPIDFAAHANVLALDTEDTGVAQASIEEVPAEPEASDGVVAVEKVTETSEVQEGHEPEALKESEPTGPTSISQQYTEQPSTAPTPGAIYDTESYHQPVTPAPKKKSSVLVIVWILLLLILGAAAGAGFYFYVLPSL